MEEEKKLKILILCVALFATWNGNFLTFAQDSATSRPGTFKECIENCPTSTEYEPLCGTDNVEYINPEAIACAQRCGIDVKIKYYERCSTNTSE
ncbi:uncharacterized protein LOC143183805 [Calliopsis andreniformis]|uniref:uncharacterized protein LOC143183805 n=1 Tax=Calliopsis andreniformis TaxID=337506 RepID=UPI003FCC82A3